MKNRRLIKRTAIVLLFVIMTTAIALAISTPTHKVFRAEVAHAEVMYPFPGYNMYYAPYYYDANVKFFQQQLNHLDPRYWCGLPDGYFGNNTLQAVKNFQADNYLVVDGIVGKITWDEMFDGD